MTNWIKWKYEKPKADGKYLFSRYGSWHIARYEHGEWVSEDRSHGLVVPDNWAEIEITNPPK